MKEDGSRSIIRDSIKAQASGPSRRRSRPAPGRFASSWRMLPCVVPEFITAGGGLIRLMPATGAIALAGKMSVAPASKGWFLAARPLFYMYFKGSFIVASGCTQWRPAV
jgi:hypothetical protein